MTLMASRYWAKNPYLYRKNKANSCTDGDPLEISNFFKLSTWIGKERWITTELEHGGPFYIVRERRKPLQ